MNLSDNFSNQLKSIASTFSTDTIFILGKGPSIDLVQSEILAGSLSIGLNDAESITPVDISIFFQSWAREAVAANGFKSRLYVCPRELEPARGQHFIADHVSTGIAETDLMMQRLLGPEFVIEEVLFVSALKIARMIAAIRKRPQKVYMVGFDFTAEAGYSKSIRTDYSNTGIDEKVARIQMQEFCLLNAAYMLRGSDIEVHHVGDRSFSTLSAAQFNELFATEIGALDVNGSSGKVKIVAELTTNHFGDRHRLERMIRAAKGAGADYVKVQKRDVEAFYTREQLSAEYRSPFGRTFRDYRQALELSLDDLEFMDALCRRLSIGWFASVLDEPSFRILRDFEPKMLKLPSTISEHIEFIELVAREYSGDVVISTGMTDVDYESWILENFRKSPHLYLLQCNSAYPTPRQDCSVGVVRRYRDLARDFPNVVPGYSSHDLGWLASALAVAAGAQMIEKHVKLGNTEWAHFDAVALDLSTADFREYVGKVREAEQIIGSENKAVNSSEHHKYFREALRKPTR